MPVLNFGKYIVYFHLKHGNAKDGNRKMDVSGLDKIREYLIDEFRETGKDIEKKPEQNIGHILQQAKVEKGK